MVDNIDQDIVEEVEKRLDDLFGDSNGFNFKEDAGRVEDAPIREEATTDIEDTPLKDLKSIVLSIEWEITDEIMNRFLGQVESLKAEFGDDKVIMMFLQLLTAVGKYIKAKKASADPDVVKLLNSGYAGLEKVLLTKNITEVEKKKLLVVEVNKFKKIKERLASKKPTTELRKVQAEEKRIGAKEDIVPAEAEKAEEPVSTREPPFWGRKMEGLGFGTRIALIVFLPLIIIVIMSFVYVSQFAGISNEINQLLQTYSGITVDGAQNVILSVLGCLVILIGLIAYAYCHNISSKIKYLISAVEGIGAGNTDVAIDIKTGGEIRALAEAIERLQDRIR